ncbi:unnamed protein product [Clonostachys rhizophaga]|uniref:Endopolyphosphatase n=1 Tax=Clonostachys rhizophaga TaxID=160324 RepID=A0A9N9VE30_9HYPO|nr:unnamed protein product [Clonostachys rhizophaga]
MAPLSHSLFLGLAFGWGHIALGSPIQDSQQQVLSRPDTNAQQRRLHGKFLHITDFHPDPFYEVHSSTEEGIACHRKDGPAGTYGAETTDCDSPFSLVNATFDWLRDNVKDEIDFIIWTGDTARHDSDEKHPRNTNEVLATNRKVADKFVETFSDPNGQLLIPIVPTFGNNDFLPHNIFYPGPNKWLRAYSDIWGRFIPEEQHHSFEFGGWFWVEAIPNHLAIFSLNTMYFFDRNAGVDGCAEPSEPGFEHMEWLRVQLQLLRERGMKAILVGHVPPARTETKKNWDETCWQKYTLWLQQYRDVVTGSLYGHMNIDHFLLQDTDELNLILNEEQVDMRGSLYDDVTNQSKEDYLQELRAGWAELPGSAIKLLAAEATEDAVAESDVDSSGKKKKKKRDKELKEIGGKYAERYQLSLVSPSIVPNYFPTLRVFEYNITGIEDQALWVDRFNQASPGTVSQHEDAENTDDDFQELRRRDVESEGKKKKKKKKHNKKPYKPKDPNFVVPEDPPKGSTPGPAYSPQLLTLNGYTQYFANLTFINNDMNHKSGRSGLATEKWRDGDFSDKEPSHKVPQPKDFAFEVEYSTFDDKVYKLKDLTVMSYLRLAYRLAKDPKGKSNSLAGSGDNLAENSDFEGDDDDLESQKRGKHKDKDNTKGRKKKKHNKAWIEFLHRAFVGTVKKKDLKKA